MDEKEKFRYKVYTVLIGVGTVVVGAATAKYLSTEAGIAIGALGFAVCGYAKKHFAD